MKNLIRQTMIKRELILNFSFSLFILLILLTRVMIFFNINLSVIDSDQPFFWIGAKDYANGIFYEPRFYGQDYNTFMESFFAVPFIWCGIPVYIAVPLATHFIFLIPVLITASCLFLKNKKEHAVLALSVILCMPTAFDILTSIPRGFVTGLFFSSFFILNILQPHNSRYIFLNTFMAVLGYFVNPNSLVVSGAVLFYIFLHNYHLKRYYIVTGIALLALFPLDLLFNGFYREHPDYVVYGLFYSFAWEHFYDNFSKIPLALTHISFFREGNYMATIAVLVIVGILLLKHNRRAFYAYLVVGAVVMASWFSGKTGDGSAWPFYSLGRMYLGIPMVICLFVVFVPVSFKKFTLPVIVITLLFSVIKLSFQEKTVERHLAESNWIGVHLVPLNDVLNAIRFYGEKCRAHQCDELVISNGFWLNTYLAYGGPAVDKDFPSTRETNSERRYQVRVKDKNSYVEKFIFISCKPNIHTVLQTDDFEMEKLDDYGLFLISNNRLSMSEFTALLHRTENAM